MAGINSAAASSSQIGVSSSSVPVKARSCIVCRTRKVRCDKQSPCSNCRRANIPCQVPSAERPPRWARRLARDNAVKASSKEDVDATERVQQLEALVSDLRSQLRQANAKLSTSNLAQAHTPESLQSETPEPPPRTAENLHQPFGRMVVNDSNTSRYVSSGFWSRVKDELTDLDSDTSEDGNDSPNSLLPDYQRAPDRSSIVFRRLLEPTLSVEHFRPLSSHVPFLLDIFEENIHSVARIVHLPTVRRMIRESRGTHLTSSEEALAFSIYYSAVISMEADDVDLNFGLSQAELSQTFRAGFELSMARADFLSAPSLILVQALTIFLGLVRRHESPRYVWMMTGLVIRMAHALGLHRDGVNFPKIAPYDSEIRRRTWWSLCTLDVRAAEDQGTEFSIAQDSFDTRMPSSINDADINPKMTEVPISREGLTEMSLALYTFKITEISKELVSRSAKGGMDMASQTHLLDEIRLGFDSGLLKHDLLNSGSDIVCWVGAITSRLVAAKISLFIHLPMLFSHQGQELSEEISWRLLVSAIEVAEYNHALNAERRCRHWRWVFQTYTHWYAIVYMLMETIRRPWSPIIERAWLALQSEWLIPVGIMKEDRNQETWIPLRRLVARARSHRDAEISRLKNDPRAKGQLDMKDWDRPTPSSHGHFSAGLNAQQLFHDHWRKLFEDSGKISGVHNTPSIQLFPANANNTLSPDQWAAQGCHEEASTGVLHSEVEVPSSTSGPLSMSQQFGPSTPPTSWVLTGWADPWLWADTDSRYTFPASHEKNQESDPLEELGSPDLQMEFDWYDWMDSAKQKEWNTGSVQVRP